MPLALTSDFPSTVNEAVLGCMRATAARPRVAWIPPLTLPGRQRFPLAQERFKALGITSLEYCDVDREPDEQQLARLDHYDVLYLTGGDPLVFRRNIERTGIGPGLQTYLAAGGLIVAASGGAMQFTANLSLVRLLSLPVTTVVAERGEHVALGIVPYELVPHANTLDAAASETLRRYSASVPCDIVALDDGAAMIHEAGNSRCDGRGVRFRGGVRTEIDPAGA